MFEQSLFVVFFCDCTLCFCLMFSVHPNPSPAAAWRSTSETTCISTRTSLQLDVRKATLTASTSPWRLIPCQANRSLGAFDELFKAHFVFNLSYDSALVSFYTFLQTTVYNIDIGKMKESPRVKDLRAKLLNQTVTLS